MARVPGCDHVYEVADLFRKHCLTTGNSLLWPEIRCWVPENLTLLWDAFIGHPDLSDRTFLEKWRDQLRNAPKDLHRVAADVLSFYYLFPADAGFDHKLKDLELVLSWIEEPSPDLSLVSAAFRTPIGNAGVPYFRRRPEQVAFYLEFAKQMLLKRVDASDPLATASIADAVQRQVKYSLAARNVLLHLLFPDLFERISSGQQKRDIVTAFQQFTGGETDSDKALLNIRRTLQHEYQRDQLDFYDDDIKKSWDTKAVPGTSDEETKSGVHCWIEKTLVRGRPDRETGEFALGKALWSPQRDKRGADIYRFMREVSAGDVVLHLTDNEAITGISRAASSFKEFGGVQGTTWGKGPSYIVPLKDFQPIDPPLSRSVLFNGRFRNDLVKILDSGQANLFYNREPSLNQGAYLTPAPAALVAVLNEAYRQVAGRPLVSDEELGDKVLENLESVGTESPTIMESQSYDLEWLVNVTLWDLGLLKDVIAVLEGPAPQVILAGPPGTGKTWVAMAIARHLTFGSPERFKLIQFHPTYGYEQFIEGLQPVVDSQNRIQFQPVPGVLLRFTSKMDADSKRRVLVIDEMNRANLPRVFGELLFLLEYREEKIDLLLQKAFSLPEKLSILGTMNTADRSIRAIDVALRRRFEIFECAPDSRILSGYYKQPEHRLEVANLLTGFEALNTDLRSKLDRHHTIGHTFFMRPTFTPDDLKAVWERKVFPLIEEYFFDEPDIASEFAASKYWPDVS